MNLKISLLIKKGVIFCVLLLLLFISSCNSKDNSNMLETSELSELPNSVEEKNDEISIGKFFTDFGNKVNKAVDDTLNKALPISANECKNQDYVYIVNKFRDAGFINVSTEILKKGIFDKENSVKCVTVAGNEDFNKGDLFSTAVKIRIYYYKNKK